MAVSLVSMCCALNKLIRKCKVLRKQLKLLTFLLYYELLLLFFLHLNCAHYCKYNDHGFYNCIRYLLLESLILNYTNIESQSESSRVNRTRVFKGAVHAKNEIWSFTNKALLVLSTTPLFTLYCLVGLKILS